MEATHGHAQWLRLRTPVRGALVVFEDVASSMCPHQLQAPMKPSMEYRQWQSLNHIVQRVLIVTANLDVSRMFSGMLAKGRWDKTKAMYEDLADIRWHRLLREILDARMEDYGSLQHYMTRLYTLKRRLKRLPERCQLTEPLGSNLYPRA